MKKQILGLFAVVILSATAITASNAHTVFGNIRTSSISIDTTPQKMMHYNKKMDRKNMDSSMDHSSMDSSHTSGSTDSTRL